MREAALRTKGSGGPLGIDANGFKRILACKSFKRSSINLCESIATLTRRLCTEFVDPLTIEPIVGNGEVRPIGVGEVIRRIIGKCVTRVAKQDVMNASGAMQLCAGQKRGGEAAIHGMCNIFEADEIYAVLLVDASNAFNSLNRRLCGLIVRVRVVPRRTVVGDIDRRFDNLSGSHQTKRPKKRQFRFSHFYNFKNIFPLYVIVKKILKKIKIVYYFLLFLSSSLLLST